MSPNKIFIPENLDWPSAAKPGDVEYIRKDSLLEWLKMAVENYSHPDPVNVVDAIRCEGKKWAFQDVINKIESL